MISGLFQVARRWARSSPSFGLRAGGTSIVGVDGPGMAGSSLVRMFSGISRRAGPGRRSVSDAQARSNKGCSICTESTHSRNLVMVVQASS
jgi:hypothetical protein